MSFILYIRLLLNCVSCLPVASDPEACPYQGCECTRDTLGCGAQGWTSLPHLLTPHLDELPFLDLNGNPLTTIQAGSLPAGLSGINFMGDPLMNIDDTALDGSSNTLKRLIFTSARFTRIPDAIGHLNVLDSLLLEDINIEDWNLDVMKQIGTTVTSLTLDNVSLSTWPTWIGNFPRLQTLEITNSNITILPDNAFDMQINELNTLRLEEGVLSEIPAAVSKLSVLANLALDYNRIRNISNLPSFGNLSYLSMDYNNLSDSQHVSCSLRSVASSLTVLQMDVNQLTSFPELSFMTKLQSIYISNNGMFNTYAGSIPFSLTFLAIESNNFRSIPSFIKGGTNLKSLRAARNAISEIVDVQLSSSISDLDLTGNMISELSNQSFPLNSMLQYLTLDYNPLSKIEPLAFAMLKHMEFLSLRSTKLTRLPLSLVHLSPINGVDMTQNPDLICTCMEKPLRAWAMEQNLQNFGDCGTVSIDTFLTVLSVDCPD